MNYQESLLRHLGTYKRSVLNIAEPGLYRHKGRDLLKEHILPLSDRSMNLLELARGLAAAHLEQRPHLKLHKHFHHLNSSQAFAFNLFLPFFGGDSDASRALLRALGLPGELATWELEAVPNSEEGTNFDAKWTDSAGATVFCEVKLSEQDFGTARGDQPHLDKLKSIYEPGLRGHVDPQSLAEDAFFGQYQILRNVWHCAAAPGSTLVFLLPRANTRLWPILARSLESVRPDTRNRIKAVAIEDVLERLESQPDGPEELRVYASQLRAKYVPPEAL